MGAVRLGWLVTLVGVTAVDGLQHASSRGAQRYLTPLLGSLEDGDAFLTEAVSALQQTQFKAAREKVGLARACYERVADADRRAEREALARSLDEQVEKFLAKTKTARAESLATLDAKRKQTASTDTDGDRLMRKAVTELAAQRYDAARTGIEAAREAFARDGISDRESALGNLYASINAEQERAVSASRTLQRTKR